jgi:hypothetical protein
VIRLARVLWLRAADHGTQEQLARARMLYCKAVRDAEVEIRRLAYLRRNSTNPALLRPQGE